MTMEILLGINSLLMLFGLFCAREWWKGHKTQHEQLAKAIEKLAEIYASKAAVFRAHKRLDALEESSADHAERIVRLETELELTGWSRACPSKTTSETK
ncbi:hypothetical protein [Desulfovibrio sp. ZJ200]|uniref:hypothetical protein n=1 Tax=Desulfovibrio sp. ZJ200 TaxID=2709792 RepID=UPI0013ECE9D2|nr:hypothetical protein [Desulfovibrio sp. ZJ200]